MATRCIICRKVSPTLVRGIYCHFDGYPDGVGACLSRHYKNADKIDALISRGDIESLGPAPTRGTHPFGYDPNDDPEAENAPFECRPGYEVLGSRHGDVEYVYLWVKGEWFVAEYDSENGQGAYEPLPEVGSTSSCDNRMFASANAELELLPEIVMVLMYLLRSGEMQSRLWSKKALMALLSQFEKKGYIELGHNTKGFPAFAISETGKDFAWSIMERYGMDRRIDPE